MEQRGTYRFAVADTSTGTDGDMDPDDGPDDGEPVAATPPSTATPAPTAVIYTTPTSAQKKNAKNGYVNRDKVNLRAGPGTKYKTVGNKIEKNTAVTLYELQDGWWFLKCGNHYGYVKADYVSQGKPKATAAAGGAGQRRRDHRLLQDQGQGRRDLVLRGRREDQGLYPVEPGEGQRQSTQQVIRCSKRS